MKLSLIGAGRLGKQLYRELTQCASIELVQWMNRPAKTPTTLEGVELVSELNQLSAVDCYLIAIRDESIEQVVSQLPQNSLVIHTSGATTLNSLSHGRKGVFYPIQSFSNEKDVNFNKLPIAIEASEVGDLTFLKQLTLDMGAQPISMDSNQRKTLHLAAVLVNNFTNHLFTQADLLCKENDLSFDLLKPLIRETVAKLEEMSPEKAQTGPALRADQKTLQVHLDLIENKELKALYKLLSHTITNHYTK